MNSAAAKTFSLPAKTFFRNGMPSGWTVYRFESHEARVRWALANQNAAMPCWKRTEAWS